MTLFIVLGTLAVVAWAAHKAWQAHKRIEAVLRGDWHDCDVCATARAQLTALFNDPKEEQ